jgi:hypothetical protein
MMFLCSITDMKCKCFSDSEAKLFEGSDSGGWGGIGMTVELSCTCGFPVVIGKGKYSFRAGELHYFGVHQGSIGFGIGECYRSGWWGVEEEVLENWTKSSERFNRQRDQYHVLGEDIANDFVTDG